jgi:hypothetical protein
MILILAILAATRASPLSLTSPPVVSLDQVQVPGPSCDDPNGCRSLEDIIRSCILTILLCTWVSMHPNIPSPDERWPKLAWRRVGLMLLALIAPEAVISWAMRQRRAAAKLAEDHKGESRRQRLKCNSDRQTQEMDGRSHMDSSRSWVVSWNTTETSLSKCCCPTS